VFSLLQVSVKVLGVHPVTATTTPMTSKLLNDIAEQGYGIMECDVV
jgi:hypothetical protein